MGSGLVSRDHHGALPGNCLCHRTTNFGMVTHVGKGVYLGVSHAPIARERSSRAPQFLEVLHLCIHPSTQITKFGRIPNIAMGVF